MREPSEPTERWLNFLALTTVVFAVCATLSTLKGGGYSTRSVVSQAEASNQWAHFQSKSIKGYLYDLQRDKLELELKAGVADGGGAYQAKIALYAAESVRYRDERTAIAAAATTLEQARDQARRQSGSFGLAAMFLQIAILLSSIAALTKRRLFWYLGNAAGCFGLLYFFDGFFVFM
ncbi:MAG: DUF4337 domain-containing protein [Kofleriaceae bacterium]